MNIYSVYKGKKVKLVWKINGSYNWVRGVVLETTETKLQIKSFKYGTTMTIANEAITDIHEVP